MNATRRELFQGLVNQAQGLPFDRREVRPPGALAGATFYDVCTRCDECQNHCPEGVITKGSGGFPRLDFSQTGCTGCSQCASACPSGALQLANGPWPQAEWMVSDACLPKQGVSCQSCKDACEWEAISFPFLTRVPSPVINDEACKACGACVAVCPTDAIAIAPRQEIEREIT